MKFRTNDSNNETDINDDPSVDSYFGMITTDYTELMSRRYYFQVCMIMNRSSTKYTQPAEMWIRKTMTR